MVTVLEVLGGIVGQPNCAGVILLLALIAALALIHLAVWAFVERRPNWQIGASRRRQFLDRVQAFDWGESVALAYIAWRLVGILH